MVERTRISAVCCPFAAGEAPRPSGLLRFFDSGGRPEESATALAEAVHLDDLKGNVIAGERPPRVLAEPPIEISGM
jgi:hypothetical protein